MLSFEDGGEDCFEWDLNSTKSSFSSASSNACNSCSSSTLSWFGEEKFVKLLLLQVASPLKLELCKGDDVNRFSTFDVELLCGSIIEEDRLLIVEATFDTASAADDRANNEDEDENELQIFGAAVDDSTFSGFLKTN